MGKKRLDVLIESDMRDYIAEVAEKEGKHLYVVTEELLALAIAQKRGEVIEQQSLPIIREIVSTELRKGLAQQRTDVREDMALEFTNELKAIVRASDNRLAGLIVRTIRDASIIRRLTFALLARSFGRDFANEAYENAKEHAGKELSNRKDVHEI